MRFDGPSVPHQERRLSTWERLSSVAPDWAAPPVWSAVSLGGKRTSAATRKTLLSVCLDQIIEIIAADIERTHLNALV
jgi:hypothetical protein